MTEDNLLKTDNFLLSKLIVTNILLFSFYLRNFPFYGFPGVCYRIGWSAPIRSHGIFFIAIAVFLAATWFSKHPVLRLSLQTGALIVIICCDFIFMEFKVKSLSWMMEGFWLHLIVFAVLEGYCFCVCRRDRSIAVK